MALVITELQASFGCFGGMSIDEVKQPMGVVLRGSLAGLLQELFELHAAEVIGKPTMLAVESHESTNMKPCSENSSV